MIRRTRSAGGEAQVNPAITGPPPTPSPAPGPRRGPCRDRPRRAAYSSGAAGPAAAATRHTPADPAVVSEWNAIVQFNAALRSQQAARRLDIVEAARMFAAVDMSVADTAISVWHSKYHYGFWRPSTAIALADTDGNPATTADPAWTPLLAAPPYPDYVSGYSGYVGAFTRSLERALGTRKLNVSLTSTAVPGATRSYPSVRQLNADVVDARVWLGIHFRFADTGGLAMGQNVAGWAADRYFRPVRG